MPEPLSITAAELAAKLRGSLVGDAARPIRGVGTLEAAGPDDVAWLGHVRLLPRLNSSRAGVVLVPADCPPVAERTLIRVADPDLAMCDALRLFAPPAETVAPGIDPTAVVAPDATVAGAAIGPHVVVRPGAVVGPGTQLHANVYVGSRARIGRDCVLWPSVVIREGSTLGDRVIIHPNATIGADGFGYHQRGGKHVKIPQVGTVVIEDDVEIGAGTCVDRARSGVTRIGRGTKIDNLVQIGHNVTLGEGCIVVAQCGISGSTSLGRYVWLGGQVGMIDHARIGDRVQVAAKSGVAGDIPDGKRVRGIPAVEKTEYGRQQIGITRLPDLLKQVRDLEKRVQRLESSADD